jgi:hypothetical protein
MLRYDVMLHANESTTLSNFNIPVHQVVNMKTKGRLIHSNIGFFNFIKKIEENFKKYFHNTEVFDLVITDLMTEKTLSFPCSIHGENIFEFAVIYYVRMRIRQFTYQENSKVMQNLNFKLILHF